MREAIIRMANKAQLCQSIWIDEEGSEEIASLIRFFELAASETRMKMVFASPNHWVQEALAAEREACAKLCDELAEDYGKAGLPMTFNALKATAKEIRGRGKS